MNETKKCPYCGEEILAVARKCKHCGEWLDRKEQIPCPVCGEQIDADAAVCPHCKEPVDGKPVTVKKEAMTTEQSFQTSFYYCKSCKARLSTEADVCPQCGDKDPFYFKYIKNSNSLATILTLFPIILIIAYPLWISTFPEGIVKISFRIGAVVWLTFLYGLRSTSRKTISEYFGTMQKIFEEYGDSEGVYRWKKDINNRRGFFSKLIGFYKIEDK